MPATAGFLGLDTGAKPDPAGPRVSVLPVPYERTTSYGRGTALGPAAILAASEQVDTWEPTAGYDLERLDLETLPALTDLPADPEAALDRIESAAREVLESGRFLATLGGEHALTTACLRAVKARHGEVGVVQFDAHADLRNEYDGTPWSHACVMRRVLDLGLPALAVGIRSLSPPEADLMRSQELPTVWGHELDDLSPEQFECRLAELPARVYLTFDVDYLDPAIMPATGTPEPGGGDWYGTLGLLRVLFRCKEVVALDLVELAPLPGQPASDFTAARLLATCLAYLAT